VKQTLGSTVKPFQVVAAGRWLSPGTPVSSTYKTDYDDRTEILLKVALNTIALTPV
jgi:hypothetical protein